MALLQTLGKEVPDFVRARYGPWLEIELEGDWFGDEQDGVVECWVLWFLGWVAPFDGFVAWWEGTCGFCELDALLFR